MHIEQWMHGMYASVVTAEDAYCGTDGLLDPFATYPSMTSGSGGSSTRASITPSAIAVVVVCTREEGTSHNRWYIHFHQTSHGLAGMTYEITILGIGFRQTVTEFMNQDVTCLTLLQIVSPESILLPTDVAFALEFLCCCCWLL